MSKIAYRERSVDVPWLACQALIGFTLGYFLLHPISMVIFHWLDPRLAYAMPGHAASVVWEPILHSFHPSMTAMGLAYGLLAGLVAAVNGYYRKTIRDQRDALGIRNKELAQLERTNRRNTQFMVHDLKNHVGCILGFANLLLDREEAHRTPECEDALLRIRRQARVIDDRIGELLDLAELQETERIHKQSIGVPGLLHAAIEVFSPLQKGQEILIGCEAKKCPPVWADESLLRRVVTNLAANSLKHNPGNVRVLVNAESRGEGSELLFSCIDDGTGIPEENLDSVFEEFKSSAEGKCDSVGLGLAFCKAAVEAHGGRIWCENNRPSGAVFYFTVPANKEESRYE